MIVARLTNRKAVLTAFAFGVVHAVACLLLIPINVSGQGNWEASIRVADSAAAQARHVEAELAYREALKQSERFNDKDPRRAVSLIKLAVCLNSQSKGEEAEVLARRSILALETALGGWKAKDQTDEYYRAETAVTILNQAAEVFLANRKYSEAESTYRRALAIREHSARTKESPKGNEEFLKLLGQTLTQSRAKVADAYERLGKLYFVQKRFEEAELLYSKSTQILEAEYGPEKPPVATSLSNQAAAYAGQGKYAMAEGLFARAVKIYEQANWLDKPEVATAFENYSLLLKKTGREADASVMLEKARQVRAKLH